MRLASSATDRLFCPHCWRMTELFDDEEECSECQERFPIQYMRTPEDLRPLAVQAMGWTGHGKSAGLAAMTYALNRASLLWPRFTCSPANDRTQRFLVSANRQVESGELPPKTRSKDVESRILLARGMGVWGNRLFTFRDSPGEEFEGMEIAGAQERFVLAAPTIWMFVSPADLSSDDGRTPDMLMSGLTDTLDRRSPETRNRSVVLIITKADLLRRKLPRKILKYLKRDRLWLRLRPGSYRQPGELDKNDLASHQREMVEIDQELRDWLVRDANVHNLVLDAERAGLQLRFSIISATGGEPSKGKRLKHAWEASRVLDPLLWAVQLDQTTGGIEKLFPAGEETGRQDRTGAPRYGLTVRHRANGVEHRVNVKNSSGTLSPVDPELAGINFSLEEEGLRFSFGRYEALEYGSGGSIRQLNEESLLLRPGEHLVWRGWYLEPCFGYFH